MKQLLTKVRVEEGYPRIEDIFDNSSSSQPSQGGQYNLKHIIHSIQHHLSLCLVGMKTTPIEPWIATCYFSIGEPDFFWIHLISGRYLKRYTKEGGRCQMVEDNNEQVRTSRAIYH